MADNPRQKIIAVSSGGGHWEQLMAMSSAFAECEVTYATTSVGLLQKYHIANGRVLPDCSRDSVVQSARCAFKAFALVWSLKPDVIISTGAAPGLLSIVAGRILGIKTVWIDSVANVEKLSLSGKYAGYFADLWLTQWEHLSSPKGPEYAGAVL